MSINQGETFYTLLSGSTSPPALAPGDNKVFVYFNILMQCVIIAWFKLANTSLKNKMMNMYGKIVPKIDCCVSPLYTQNEDDRQVLGEKKAKCVVLSLYPSSNTMCTGSVQTPLFIKSDTEYFQIITIIITIYRPKLQWMFKISTAMTETNDVCLLS